MKSITIRKICLVFFMLSMLGAIGLSSTARASDPVGAEEAIRLSGDATLIMNRGVVLDEEDRLLTPEQARVLEETGHLEIEREGYLANVATTLGDCPRSSESSSNERIFHVDITLRAHIVGGFDEDGVRTPYEEANFNLSVDAFRSRFGDQIEGMQLNSATDVLMNGPGSRRFSSRSQAYQHVLRDRLVSASPQERRRLLAAAGEAMSFDEQVEFISRLGGQFSERYDHSRAAETVGARAIPDCDAMISNLSGNADIGVCRDIHLCMAHVMQQMGNEGNVYGLSYASGGNYHVSLIASDPRNPARVHNINYYEHSVANDRVGAAAMAQDHSIPDVGISYRLWRPDGSGGGTMVSSMPSQMGLVLNEVTGGNNERTFDPETRSDYSLLSTGAGAGPWGARAFATRLSNGDTVIGAATSVSWGERPEENGQIFNGLSQSGNIGLAFAHREVNERPGISDFDVNMIYLNFQQRVGVPMHFDRLTIEPEVGLVIQGTAIEGGSDPDRDWTGDGNLTWDARLRAEYESTDESTRIGLEGGTQMTLGLEDIRGLFGSDAILVFNHGYARADLEQVITPDARVNVALMMVFREYGDSFRATVGGEIDSEIGTTSVRAGLGMPLPQTGPVNGFMPAGANHTLALDVNQRFDMDADGTSLDIGANWDQNLDDGQYIFNTTAAFHF